jgi:hypothetical protein
VKSLSLTEAEIKVVRLSHPLRLTLDSIGEINVNYTVLSVRQNFIRGYQPDVLSS